MVSILVFVTYRVLSMKHGAKRLVAVVEPARELLERGGQCACLIAVRTPSSRLLGLFPSSPACYKNHRYRFISFRSFLLSVKDFFLADSTPQSAVVDTESVTKWPLTHRVS
jgi:hypothetical protein